MRPSEIKNCVIKFNKVIPFGNFLAMMWKGKILIKEINQEYWKTIESDSRGKTIINHENIHLKQAVSTNDSWFYFYLNYVWQYLKNLPIIFGFEFPYRFISFELEAKGFANNFNYLEGKKSCDRWKSYNKLSLKEKRKYWKQYKELNNISLSSFIKEYISINDN